MVCLYQTFSIYFVKGEPTLLQGNQGVQGASAGSWNSVVRILPQDVIPAGIYKLV